ncbi:MAG: hypothetical protein Tsb0034_16530 [Ekhidna sp.]
MRKVLGANIRGLILHLFKPFTLLISIAFILVTPVTLYLLNTWLTNYAYSVGIQWWVFPVAGGLVLVTAFIAIVMHSLKIEQINPARTLKDE